MKYKQLTIPFESFYSKGFVMIYNNRILRDGKNSEFNISQHANIMIWGYFPQLVIYMFYVGMGAFFGTFISLSAGIANPSIGCVIGIVVFWLLCSYDLVCLKMIQEKLYLVYKESGAIRIWWKRLTLNLYISGDTYIAAKTPISILYLLSVVKHKTYKI